jgi:hypothetical protein
MKKLIKIFFSSILALSMMTSILGESAFAATKTISIVQYENAMSKIYAQYGIDWKLTDSSNMEKITPKILSSELARAEAECKSVQEQLSTANAELQRSLRAQIASIAVQPYSIMPYNTTVYATYTVSNLPFYKCDYKAYAFVTINGDNDLYISINSSGFYNAFGYNFDDFTDQGSTILLAGGNTYCRAHYLGLFNFSYTSPVGGKISTSIPVNSSNVMS